MCRLAAYIGSELSLQEFIISPPHSLYKQSWQPKEMQEATLNADGFGFAWYDDKNSPRHYRNTVPIWADVNLMQLSSTLKSNLWLAYVRSATPGQGMGINNTQPFIHENLTFVHNGFIKEFDHVKTQFIEFLSTEILADIKGDTDSEYLFALFKQIYSNHNSILDSYKEFCQQLKILCGEKIALVNIIISDGRNIGALKFAHNSQPPSLYYLITENGIEKSIRIASEPFDDQIWESIPSNSVLLIDKNLLCQTYRLD